jgi:hypothetical protein
VSRQDKPYSNTYQSHKSRTVDPEHPVIHHPYTVTTEKFEGHIQGPTRGAKKQKTVQSTRAILNDLRIQRDVNKRASTWIFDSAFDATLKIPTYTRAYTTS